MLPASIYIMFHPAQAGSVHLLLRRDVESVAGEQIQDLEQQKQMWGIMKHPTPHPSSLTKHAINQEVFWKIKITEFHEKNPPVIYLPEQSLFTPRFAAL